MMVLTLLALFAPACSPVKKTNQGGNGGSHAVASIQKINTAADLKAKLGDKTVLVVNALTKEDFAREHIPGTIHIYFEDVSPATLNRPKDAPVIFYCAAYGCPVSRRAAQRAVDAGYTNVSVFEGGMQEWKTAGYDIATGP